MSLDWNVSKIDDHEEICFETRDGHDGHGRYVSPVTETLIWATISVGIGDITEKSYEDFYQRISFYESARGAFLRTNKGKPRPITLQDVRDHIGLWTNASRLTKTQFLSQLYKGHCWDVKREIQKQKEKSA